MAADPSTLTAQAAGADGWTRLEHLLAMVVDELRVANWQRSKDGNKPQKRPRRISPLASKQERIGQTDMDPDQVHAYLDRLNPEGR